MHGELVGRCANGQGRSPEERSGAIGFRCCAGPENAAEVSLLVAHARRLDARSSIDRGLTAKLLEAMPEARGESWWGRGRREWIVCGVGGRLGTMSW